MLRPKSEGQALLFPPSLREMCTHLRATIEGHELRQGIFEPGIGGSSHSARPGRIPDLPRLSINKDLFRDAVNVPISQVRTGIVDAYTCVLPHNILRERLHQDGE